MAMSLIGVAVSLAEIFIICMQKIYRSTVELELI